MGFTTYENVANRHVTIHADGCSQIKKHGGDDKHGYGSYKHHETFEDALTYAKSTDLPVKACSFCKPGSSPSVLKQPSSENLDPESLLENFRKVAALAGVRLTDSNISIEVLNAPHKPPTKLPPGKMAVYVFAYGDKVLKVGKVGPRSNARYTSQHYNPGSAPSTLAASLLAGGESVGLRGVSKDTVSQWIKENTERVNFLLDKELGIHVLTLLESYLHCKLHPVFEGHASQK